MNKVVSYVACLVLAWALTACNSAPEPKVTENTAYEDSVYCFNRRSIVTLGGLKGIVDDSGNTVLRPEWDSAEFLDDDVALLSKEGLWYLCTRDGRVFASSASPEELEETHSERLEALLEADILYWDNVLDRLQALCDACISAHGGKRDENVIRENSALRHLLEEAPGGSMTGSQQERLDRIEREFKSMYAPR